MNLKELDEFRLENAVKFNTVLNPALFKNDKLDPEVRDQLLLIAKDFIAHLGVNDLDVKDITLSGSNAAFTYTPHSDIDLHIIVDIAKLRNDEVYRELFNSKKVVFNDSHDIKIHGYDVELYVQDTLEPVKSLGEYSVMKDKWIKYPSRKIANFDEFNAREKFKKLIQLIELALRSGDLNKIDLLLQTIRKYRQAGLSQFGEFGAENLAYKALRSKGIIDQLYKHRDSIHSADLSIDEYMEPNIAPKEENTLENQLSNELAEFMNNEDYDPNEKPPGPEFKPTMPAGTVKVDVSDVYDWYKLGQHVSNLKGLGKHDFGKGPPSTIMAFGSEDEVQLHELYGSGDTLKNWDWNTFNDKLATAVFLVDEQVYKLQLKLVRKNSGIWNIEFINMSTPGDNGFSILGTGNASLVLSNTVEIIRDFLNKKGNNVKRFTYTAIEPSRQRLYRSIAKRVTPDWKLAQNDENFTLTRPSGRNVSMYEQGLSEASGYIPSEKEKNDPRFKTALTVDVKPTSIKDNAKKLGLGNIKRAGIPPVAKSSGKV